MLIFLLLLVWCVSPARAATGLTIEQFTLKNGLEVVVIPNNRVPAVNHMLWFRIGSADDPQGKSGLAHFHEHLMFKGTEHFKLGEYEALIARNGGEQNAFTNYDITGYYASVPKSFLPKVMELEADRIRGIIPDDKETLKEREVIIEERRMRIENNPAALFAEQMNAALYLNHPYHVPVIGWKHEMEGLTKDDVLTFHRTYYHPNNTVLVLSGDITVAEAMPLAEKHYGGLKNTPVPKRVWKDEPPHIAARTLTLMHPNVKQPEWQRNYLAPSLVYGDTTQAMPLMVLAHLLGGGKTSVLYQELVTKRKLATDIDVDYSAFTRGPSEFEISVTPAAGVTMEIIEKEVGTLLESFLNKGADAKELARAKTLLKAESIYAREGLHSMAQIVGMIRMLDLDAQYFTRWPEIIDAVTLEQIHHAAKAVIKPNASVTGYLLPEQPKEAPHAP